MAATIYAKYNTTTVAIYNEKKTTDALKKAKEALIYYSLNNTYLNSVTCVSNTNCSRPGDLPCPDTNNDGIAESSCGNAAGNNQTLRLSRLPWKTLGLGDITDGYGEHLWYAVSNNYKNNTRTRPLNSDTLGTITVRDGAGKVIYDATNGSGVVAVIFSPGNPITRQDGYVQNRSVTGLNNPNNYLDVAFGEDNASFTDGSGSDGFILGPIKDANSNVVLNDRLIVITRDEMAVAMETYVLTQVRDAFLTYYNTNSYYPYPALFSDTSCIVSTSVNITAGCNSQNLNYEGRIPVFNLDQSGSTWTSTSILKGLQAGNWFQQNLWRELIYYGIAPACEITTPNCAGLQKLTLNNATLAPQNMKNMVIISAGKAISTQSRVSKSSVSNYFEGENATPLDFIYDRPLTINNVTNDRAMSIP
ncbi:MAG: hypothetical protein V4493_06620 [Pseudomonadota bacterium]